MTIDIFCDVIDNFGDAGVCWRLASIFSCEHGFPVKLYINDAETLSKITAGLDPKKLPCLVQGVEIHDWKDAETSEPSQVVIETFGCRLPIAFEHKIAAARPQPIWINLEYLSAEDWVEGCHSLPSPHPSLNVNKYYFFPGVTKKTGGLMIEKDLFIRQERFAKDRNKFLESFNWLNFIKHSGSAAKKSICFFRRVQLLIFCPSFMRNIHPEIFSLEFQRWFLNLNLTNFYGPRIL